MDEIFGQEQYACLHLILLIARLGLRSSDVANLRFSNIDWEKEVIRLTQVKTGSPLELPLLEDIGVAIINYLKNARRKTDSHHVFVRQVPPYTEFNPDAVGSLVRVHLQKSGIHLEGKKKGSHTLRHSLASRLLEHKIPLPVSDSLPYIFTHEQIAAVIKAADDECIFPSDWTMDSLLQRHQSRPYNPKIARAFFRAGYIESWGRGIQKILIYKAQGESNAAIAERIDVNVNTVKLCLKKFKEGGVDLGYSQELWTLKNPEYRRSQRLGMICVQQRIQDVFTVTQNINV